jgi:small GTP-binding protein
MAVTTISKKICLLGDIAVGKTSLVRRFVYNLFDDKYLSTIGVKVSRKMLTVPADGGMVELNLMLWDLAGSEEFSQVRASYLRGAAGAVLVCDLTRSETLTSLQVYADNLRSINPNAQLAVAANKLDLSDQHELATTQIEAFAASFNAPCCLTSAKTGTEVNTLFRRLGSLLLS